MKDNHLLDFIGDDEFRKKQITKSFIEDVKYSKFEIPIGRTLEGNVFTVDVRKPFHMIYYGITRTGKSYFEQAKISRMYKSGIDIVIPSDAKGEWKYCKLPAQPKFQKNYMKGEVAEGMKMVVFRPRFFSELDNEELPQMCDYWLSLSFSEMQKADFHTIVSYEKRDENKKASLDIIWSWIEKKQVKTIEQIIERAIDLEAMPSSVINIFRALETKGMFQEKYVHNLIEWTKKGYVVCIDTSGFETFGDSGSMEIQAMTAIILRKYVEAKRKKLLLKRLHFVWEEAGVLLPPNANPVSKKEIINATRRYTAFGVTHDALSQTPETIDEQYSANCQYLAVPRNIPREVLIKILRQAAVISHAGREFHIINDITKKLQMKPYAWLILNRNGDMHDKVNIITSFDPLCFHVEASS